MRVARDGLVSLVRRPAARVQKAASLLPAETRLGSRTPEALESDRVHGSVCGARPAAGHAERAAEACPPAREALVWRVRKEASSAGTPKTHPDCGQTVQAQEKACLPDWERRSAPFVRVHGLVRRLASALEGRLQGARKENAEKSCRPPVPTEPGACRKLCGRCATPWRGSPR